MANLSLCSEIFQTIACLKWSNTGSLPRRSERFGLDDDSTDDDATWVDDAVWYDSLWVASDAEEHEELLSVSGCSQEYCNMMKRRSRDMETETDEELLLLVFPAATADHSSGSLSSSVSLSDKSVSTDNNAVEEYVGDVPFAGKRRFFCHACTFFPHSFFFLHIRCNACLLWLNSGLIYVLFLSQNVCIYLE